MGKPVKPLGEAKSRRELWQALRIKRQATTGDLRTITGRPKNSLQVDLRHLRRTGYIERVGRVDAVWRLVRDTGPKPPSFLYRPEKHKRRLIGAMDGNTREIFGADGKSPPAPDEIGRRHHLQKMPVPRPR